MSNKKLFENEEKQQKLNKLLSEGDFSIEHL